MKVVFLSAEGMSNLFGNLRTLKRKLFFLEFGIILTALEKE